MEHWNSNEKKLEDEVVEEVYENLGWGNKGQLYYMDEY